MKESFEVTRLVNKFERRTGKFVISVSYRTRTQVTPRTLAVAEAFGVGVDGFREFAVFDDWNC